jgi:hypothetical protein
MGLYLDVLSLLNEYIKELKEFLMLSKLFKLLRLDINILIKLIIM